MLNMLSVLTRTVKKVKTWKKSFARRCKRSSKKSKPTPPVTNPDAPSTNSVIVSSTCFVEHLSSIPESELSPPLLADLISGYNPILRPGWTYIHPLGSGTFGTVVLAAYANTLYALKIIKNRNIDNELYTMQILSYTAPHYVLAVPSGSFSWREGDLVCFVSEYCPGGTIASISGSVVSYNMVRLIFAELVRNWFII